MRRDMPGMMVDVLKTVRAQPSSRDDVAEALGVDPKSASRWLHTLESRGLVVGHQQATDKRGSGAVLYSLAPAWRGSDQ